MKTIVVYEPGDRVRVLVGRDDWHKGDVAEVVALGWDAGRQRLILKAANERPRTGFWADEIEPVVPRPEPEDCSLLARELGGDEEAPADAKGGEA